MPSLRLIVLRSPKLDTLRSFYELLGMSFTEEKHGKAPRHFAATLGELVLELYPGADESPVRLGFCVANLDEIVQTFKAGGGAVKEAPHENERGYQTVLVDPDGRMIELTQE